MRVLVCGGRNYRNGLLVRQVLDDIHAKNKVEVVIEGGASGADRFAQGWARSRGVRFETFKAEWEDLSTGPLLVRKHANGRLYNAAAGVARNQRMIDEGKPDLVVAFPGGDGTADMVRRAEQASIQVRKVMFNEGKENQSWSQNRR